MPTDVEHTDIGEYEVLGQIAESRWSRVLMVRPHGLDRVRAMKIAKQGSADRLAHEKACLEKLGGHPNIVDIYSQNVDSETPFVVIDYAPSTLRSELSKRKKLNTTDTFQLITQVLDGLHHAHTNNILHLDLKPENILVKDGNAMICDFNLAKKSLEERVENSVADEPEVVGTVDYMAPEQRKGKPCLHSDIYALGVITYELLMGRVPDRNSPKPSSAGAPKWVDDFVYKAMQEDPHSRYESAAEARAFIKSGLEGKFDHSRFEGIRSAVARSWPTFSRRLKTTVKHTVLSPAYLLGAPIFLGKYCWNSPSSPCWDRYTTGALLSIVLGIGMYGVAPPISYIEWSERRLESVLVADAPRGTIVCNDANTIYAMNARDVRRGEAYARQEWKAPVDDISVLAASPRSLYFIGSTGNTHSLYRLTLETGSFDKLVSSAVFRVATDLALSAENGQDVPYVLLEDEVWRVDPETRALSVTDKQALPTSRSVHSPDRKYVLTIDDSNDLELQFADERWGNIDIVSNSRDHRPIRNAQWLPE